MNILFFILILLVNILTPASVLAGNDLTVSCEPGPAPDPGFCETIPDNTPLFDETKWLPGNSITQTLTIQNQSPENDCNLYLSADTQADSVLKNVLENKISHNSSIVHQATMAQLLDAPTPIFLETIPTNQTYIYQWTTDMHTSANNNYQDLSLVFDLNLNFTCGIPPEPTPTPVPSSPACGLDAPGAPSGPTASPGGLPGEVLLSWTAPSDTLTHYAVLYGLASGDYLYGNWNVGTATTYTVSGLVPGQSYYFTVMAINDCAPGPYAEEVLGTATSGALPPGIVPNESAVEFEQIRGATTEAGELGGGDEKGASTGINCCPKLSPWWWILLLFELFFLTIFYHRDDTKRKNTLLIHILLPTLLILLHVYLRKFFDAHYGFSLTPRWTAFFPLMAFMLSFTFYPFEEKK